MVNKLNKYAKNAEIRGDVVFGATDVDGKDRFTLNYNLESKLNWTLDGSDNITIVYRGGNFDNSTFGTGFSFWEAAMSSGNSQKIGRFYYDRKFNDDATTVYMGPIIRADDMMTGLWDNAERYFDYDNFDAFAYDNTPNTINLGYTGAGLGISHQIETGNNGSLMLSANYVVNNAADSSIGIATSESGSSGGIRADYNAETDDSFYKFSLSYSRDQNVGLAIGNSSTASRDNYGISASWKGKNSSPFIPSISAGYGFSDEKDVSDNINTWTATTQWTGFNGDDRINIGYSAVPYYNDGTSNNILQLNYTWDFMPDVEISFNLLNIVEDNKDDVWGFTVVPRFCLQKDLSC